MVPGTRNNELIVRKITCCRSVENIERKVGEGKGGGRIHSMLQGQRF